MWFLQTKNGLCASNGWFCSEKHKKTQFSWYLWRHNSKWRHFTVFNITPFDSSLKFLWVRCDFYNPRMVYGRQTDDFAVKNVKTPFSLHLWRHNSKWRHFTVFNITPLDSSLKFLWVRCDFNKPRMVYEPQTDDFVVKNAKNTIFSTFVTS